MFSSNIIVRDQALAELINLNGPSIYYIGVVVLMVACWKLSQWI